MIQISISWADGKVYLWRGLETEVSHQISFTTAELPNLERFNDSSWMVETLYVHQHGGKGGQALSFRNLET